MLLVEMSDCPVVDVLKDIRGESNSLGPPIDRRSEDYRLGL